MADPTTPPTLEPNQRPSATPTPPVSGPLASIEAKLYDWLVHKAPFQLPKGLTDFIVTYGPWITLVIGILMLPAFFAVFTIASYVGTVGTAYGSYGYQPGFMYWLSLIVLLVQIIIMFISIPMLLKRQRRGWLLLFYAGFISLVYGFLNSFAYNYFNIGTLLWSLISATIAFYILFQIRHYYVK